MKRKLAIFISGSLMLNSAIATTDLFADTKNNTAYSNNAVTENKADDINTSNSAIEVVETTTEAYSEISSEISEETTEGTTIAENEAEENGTAVNYNLNALNAVNQAYVELKIDEGSITITDNGYYVDSNFFDYSGANYVIAQNDSSVNTSNTITVESGNNIITLKGVNMQSDTTAPISITTSGDTTLLIDGENTVKTTAADNAGIEKNGDSTGKLIFDKVNDDKTDILNAGSTTDGAAIGSKKSEALQGIYINGGTINANCTGFAAGIGSGIYKSASYIYINGGIVTASSRMQGAGIGGGAYGEGHHIYINGGSVTANGGMTASGIGAGGAAKGSYIYINGGSVLAKGKTGAQDIGGGSNSYKGDISEANKLEYILNNETDNQIVYLYKINGLTDGETITIDNKEMVVPAKHSSGDTYSYLYLTKEAHKIVTDNIVMDLAIDDTTGEFTLSFDELDISKGNITITSSGFMINDSTYDYTGDYTITQSNSNTETQNTITVESGSHKITLKGINIFSSTSSPFNITTSEDTTILLDGLNLLNTNAIGCAGLQKNGTYTGKLIIDKVNDDKTDILTVNGYLNGAGIGGGSGCFGNNIEIKGGTINATGGDNGAGIGGGSKGASSNITISGGFVNATGGIDGAGIGTGASSSSNPNYAEKIYITGGNIVAKGRSGGAGIGGGANSPARKIYISGGNVKAISDLEENIGSGENATPMDNILNNPTDNIAVAELKISADTVPTELFILTGSNYYKYPTDGISLFNENDENYFVIYAPINDAENGEYSTIRYNGNDYKIQINKDGNKDVITDIDIPSDFLSISQLKYGNSLLPENKEISITVSRNNITDTLSPSQWNVKKDNGSFEAITADSTAEIGEYIYEAEFSGGSKYIFDMDMLLPSSITVGRNFSTIYYTCGKIICSKTILSDLSTPVLDAITYSQTATLNDVALPSTSNGSWVWVNPNEIPSVNKTSYKAKFIPNDLAGTDYSLVDGWNDTDEVVYRDISVTVNAKTLDSDNINLEYSETEFDGSSKCPNIIIKDGDTVLSPNSDYTYAFDNNVNAGSALVNVYFMGNYQGSVSKSFVITPKALDSDNVELEYLTTEYDGSGKCPNIIIKDGDIILSPNSDYTYAFDNNVNASSALVNVSFMGNYQGSASKSFVITPKTLGSDNVELEYLTTEFDGSSKCPNIIIKDGDKILSPNSDYTYAFDNNVNVGSALVSISFMGNYQGSASKSFVITPKTLDSDNVELEYLTTEFDGSSKCPNIIIKDGDKILSPNSDYTYAFDNNVNAGSALVNVSFIGNYQGSANISFVITPKTLGDNAVSLEYSSVKYDKTAKEPNVTAKDGELLLTKGIDYNVTYSDNINIGTATVTITFIGNYSGTVTKNFNIAERIPEVSLEYLTTEYSGKAKEPKVTIKDDDITLVEGIDYDISYSDNINIGFGNVTIVYKDKYFGTETKSFEITPKTLGSNNIELEYLAIEFDGNSKKPTISVIDGDIILVDGIDYVVSYADNVNVGSAKAIVSFKGNYKGIGEKIFDIAPKALNADNINIEYLTTEFDGKSKEPTITIIDGDITLVDGVDYAVSYADNVNAGSAKAIVSFKGNYKGMGEKIFDITPKALTTDNIELEYLNTEFDGNAKEPTITIIDEDITLVDGVDYVVSYADNVNIGTATATIQFKGNYKGTITKTFEIINKTSNEIKPEITLEYSKTRYNGTAKKPKVTVKNGEDILEPDIDYDVSYSDNVEAGTATVTVTLKGQYKGTATKTFEISSKSLSRHKYSGVIIITENPSNSSINNTQEHFVDLDNVEWAKESIERLADKNIILGIGNKKFAPNSPITRADTAVMINRILNLEATNDNKFIDVSKNTYYYTAITALRENNIIYGYNNTFAPNKNVTREDAFCMLERVLAYCSIEVNEDKNNLSEFADSALISKYAENAVSKLVELKIISGNNGKINPKDNITRAEMAVILDKVISLLPQENS